MKLIPSISSNNAVKLSLIFFKFQKVMYGMRRTSKTKEEMLRDIAKSRRTNKKKKKTHNDRKR